MRKCKVENCNKKHFGKGYCQAHYYWFRKCGYIPERTRFTKNEIKICGDYCVMSLYNKNCKKIAETKFDKKHLTEIKKYKWGLDGGGYASNGRCKIRLHNFLIGKKNGLVVDHINRNRLDNRDENLRLVSQAINTRNSGLFKTNKSGFKGVHWNKEHNYWVAQIKVKRKALHLGAYFDIERAIEARKQAENFYWGQNY